MVMKRDDLIDPINAMLDRICSKLFSQSLNYSPNIRVYRCPNACGMSLQSVASVAFGEEARVSRSQSVSKSDVLNDFAEALRFRGDRGSHPSLEYLESPISDIDFRAVEAAVSNLLDQSDLLLSFSLDEGHPFYPVFWGFAFLCEVASDSILFIGSSSD